MAGLFAFLVPLAAAAILGAGLVAIVLSFEQRCRPLEYYDPDDKSKRRGRAPSSSPRNRQNTENSNLKQRVPNPCGICGENIPKLTECKLPCNHKFHENCIVAHFKRHQNPQKIAPCPAPGCSKDYSIGL